MSVCMWDQVCARHSESLSTLSLSSSSSYHETCSPVFSKANDRFRSALSKINLPKIKILVEWMRFGRGYCMQRVISKQGTL